MVKNECFIFWLFYFLTTDCNRGVDILKHPTSITEKTVFNGVQRKRNYLHTSKNKMYLKKVF